MNNDKNGFSLVELSIVLVILGLLTGGILGGQNLMRAAELRSVVTEFKTYQAAINTFQDKYFAMPGDMTNAGEFWGYPGDDISNCPDTAGSGTETCNGDGDSVPDHPSADEEYGERFMFWQHMANAGLVAGDYTGIAGPGGIQDVILGENIPRSKLGDGGWEVTGWGDPSTGDSAAYDNTYNHALLFGKKRSVLSVVDPVLKPEEMWNIDTKVDDGRPAYGKVIARHYGDAVGDNKCTINAASSADLESDYNLAYDGVACAAYFNNAF